MYCVPKNVAGVYALRHISTDLIYIGVSTVCIYNRLKWHFVKLRQGTHPTRRLQELWCGEMSDLSSYFCKSARAATRTSVSSARCAG